jgi:peroxiredoxin
MQAIRSSRMLVWAALAAAWSLSTFASAQEELPPAPARSAADENVDPVRFDSLPPTTDSIGPKELRRRAFQEGIEDVRRSGLLQQALGVGDKAIDFELPMGNGANIRLSEMLAVGPVVVTFYRGNWCPYCNRQLQGLQEVLLELHSAGAQLVAVSPEVPDQALATQQKNHLAFPVLSDKQNIVARQYGIVFHLSDNVIPYYDQLFDIEAQNGDRSYELPLAATYVIGADGVIRYAFLDADYKHRADPQEILATLRREVPVTTASTASSLDRAGTVGPQDANQ